MAQSEKIVVLLRRLVLGLVVFGLLGMGAELVLLHHYEDWWQLVPLILIGVALAVVAGHVCRPGAASIRVLQTTMTLFVVAGVVGVVLHYRASLEFQLESGAAVQGWSLFWKVLQAKAPPALAPGSMAQLGLLGLIYTFRHPALVRSSPKIV